MGNFLFPAEVGESGAKLIESAPTASVWHIHQNGEDAYEIPNEANFENLRLLEKNELQYEDQLYEDVDGFDSLRKMDTIHQRY